MFSARSQSAGRVIFVTFELLAVSPGVEGAKCPADLGYRAAAEARVVTTRLRASDEYVTSTTSRG